MTAQHELVTRAESVRDDMAARLDRELCRIAAARAAELVKEFRRRLPRHSLRVQFGNGSEYCTIGTGAEHIGRALTQYGRYTTGRKAGCVSWSYDSRTHGPIGDEWPRGACLQFVADALADIVDICDGYSAATPADIMVSPRQTRKV